MAAKDDHPGNDPKLENERGLNRRDFVKTGVAAGLGSGALLGSDEAKAQVSATGAEQTVWDYEADVVIAGGGCAGLTAAIRARDLGASVLVIDQNFDLGGRMLHSAARMSLGGGDPVQLRDMRGESDREGLITVAPAEDPEELDDNIELLFTDLTDWSVVDPKAQSPYRYNERELARSWAENCPATRQFLIDNYVRFSRVSGTHGGGGLSRARLATCFLMLGDKTDIKAGTITAEDAGVADRERSSAFAPVQMGNASRSVGPNAVANGAALSVPSHGRSSSRPGRRASSSCFIGVSTRSCVRNPSRAGFWESRRTIRRGSTPRPASFCRAIGRTEISTSGGKP